MYRRESGYCRECGTSVLKSFFVSARRTQLGVVPPLPRAKSHQKTDCKTVFMAIPFSSWVMACSSFPCLSNK